MQKAVTYDVPSLGVWNSPTPNPNQEGISIPLDTVHGQAPTYIPASTGEEAPISPYSGDEGGASNEFNPESSPVQSQTPGVSTERSDPYASTGEMLHAGDRETDYYAAMVISTHGSTFTMPETHVFTQEQVQSGEVQTFADSLRDKGIGFDAIPVSDQWINESDTEYASHENEWQEVEGPVHEGYTDTDYASDHNTDHDQSPSSVTDDAYGFGTDTSSGKGGYW